MKPKNSLLTPSKTSKDSVAALNNLLEGHMVSLVGELKTDFASLEAKMDKVESTIADPAIFSIKCRED